MIFALINCSLFILLYYLYLPKHDTIKQNPDPIPILIHPRASAAQGYICCGIKKGWLLGQSRRHPTGILKNPTETGTRHEPKNQSINQSIDQSSWRFTTSHRNRPPRWQSDDALRWRIHVRHRLLRSVVVRRARWDCWDYYNSPQCRCRNQYCCCCCSPRNSEEREMPMQSCMRLTKADSFRGDS